MRTVCRGVRSCMRSSVLRPTDLSAHTERFKRRVFTDMVSVSLMRLRVLRHRAAYFAELVSSRTDKIYRILVENINWVTTVLSCCRTLSHSAVMVSWISRTQLGRIGSDYFIMMSTHSSIFVMPMRRRRHHGVLETSRRILSIIIVNLVLLPLIFTRVRVALSLTRFVNVKGLL